MLITRHEEHNSLFLYNNILVSDDQLIYKTAVEKDWFTDNNNLYWDYTNEEKANRWKETLESSGYKAKVEKIA